jgi:hypothetical protein
MGWGRTPSYSPSLRNIPFLCGRKTSSGAVARAQAEQPADYRLFASLWLEPPSKQAPSALFAGLQLAGDSCPATSRCIDVHLESAFYRLSCGA